MSRKPTVKDIAQLAGVSATAVSMALRDHPRIGVATKKKIVAVAKKLHYLPNHAARTLKTERSGTLGLVITNILNPFYPELAKGIEDKAMELKYNIILCSTDYDANRQNDIIGELRSKGVDGIVFASVLVNDPHITPLVTDGFPFVLVNRRIHNRRLEKKIDCVVMDNVIGGRMAIEHLYGLGHRSIAIVTGSLDTSTAVERTQGAREALVEHGLPVRPELIRECGYSKQDAYRMTRELLALRSPPTAIFAENDYMALGVREAILDSGLRIPADVALVGFDDIEATSLRGVEITTISQKKYEMGALAVDCLVERIEGKRQLARQIVLQPEVIIRRSCGSKKMTVPKTAI
jgi:LacI family transcriptional regulator